MPIILWLQPPKRWEGSRGADRGNSQSGAIPRAVTGWFGAEDERPLVLQSFITTWEYFNKILPQDGIWEAHVHPPERPRSLLVPSY
ncbi:hypothetical protein F751_4404 [Auxenochlorella protothecoides]|uniref:Uncharacterized protein n=1 Tax=Auxenochlorella protothecoides TaxID=3075 RepID=A0A087SCR8_AUXPR|nr:hypothetical protein F751_4404 [Auxenochlorella protothecoides]KFM23522.1 hypothetical protein F751_4404 [Auxenochlorella protothecoides]